MGMRGDSEAGLSLWCVQVYFVACVGVEMWVFYNGKLNHACMTGVCSSLLLIVLGNFWYDCCEGCEGGAFTLLSLWRKGLCTYSYPRCTFIAVTGALHRFF